MQFLFQRAPLKSPTASSVAFFGNWEFLNKTLASLGVAATVVFSSSLSSAEAANLAKPIVNGMEPRYVTAGNPEDYVVQPGTGFDGVVRLFLETTLDNFDCSGSLLTSGRHILTAAHCFTDDFGSNITTATTAFFDLPTGAVAVDVANFFIYPDWGGFADLESFGGDIAVLELASVAPQVAERYDIYRATDEIGQVGVKVGYGDFGQGNSGDILPDGQKRSGQNRYDAPGELWNTVPNLGDVNNMLPNATLAYDFDNGLPENDAFGVIGLPDLGLGQQEVNSAPGDSGGPTFINGLIAGLTSGGLCFGFDVVNYTCSTLPDIDNTLNSSFGEFSFDTRVSTYASWVDGIVGNSPTRVPEPGMIGALVLTSLAAFGYRKSRI